MMSHEFAKRILENPDFPISINGSSEQEIAEIEVAKMHGVESLVVWLEPTNKEEDNFIVVSFKMI